MIEKGWFVDGVGAPQKFGVRSDRLDLEASHTFVDAAINPMPSLPNDSIDQ